MTHDLIKDTIKEYYESCELNKVEELELNKIFDLPLVGIATVGDELFSNLKSPELVGKNHLLPQEWLPGARSVISYFIPFSDEVRLANRKKGLPAKEWLYGRVKGQQFNEALSKRIARLCEEHNGTAVIPAVDPSFSLSDGMNSNWSERHVAYIAGLGTFSLSKSLITEKGSAGRLGSIITTLEIEPTSRCYQGPYEYCSFCGECIKRCPSNAIKDVKEQKVAGMDRKICQNYLNTKIRPRFKPFYGCGKCQTAVQCEGSNPVEDHL